MNQVTEDYGVSEMSSGSFFETVDLKSESEMFCAIEFEPISKVIQSRKFLMISNFPVILE